MAEVHLSRAGQLVVGQVEGRQGDALPQRLGEGGRPFVADVVATQDERFQRVGGLRI